MGQRRWSEEEENRSGRSYRSLRWRRQWRPHATSRARVCTRPRALAASRRARLRQLLSMSRWKRPRGGTPERARGGVGRARRDNARARPARHPAGRVGNVHDGAHRASHALALVRMARPAATNTRPKCTARASRPESAKSAPAWQLPPFLFVTSRRVTNPQLDTTRTNRGAARCLVRERIERIDEYRYS